jgi:hypothetical protein
MMFHVLNALLCIKRCLAFVNTFNHSHKFVQLSLVLNPARFTNNATTAHITVTFFIQFFSYNFVTLILRTVLHTMLQVCIHTYNCIFYPFQALLNHRANACSWYNMNSSLGWDFGSSGELWPLGALALTSRGQSPIAKLGPWSELWPLGLALNSRVALWTLALTFTTFVHTNLFIAALLFSRL